VKNYLDISGHIKLEGSKSIMNRVLIIASYLTNPIKIYNPSSCVDIATMSENLSKLGMEIKKLENSWIINPSGNIPKSAELYIHDSGTAYRFLTARIAAERNLKCRIDISDQLKKRPIKQLIEVLEQMGAEICLKQDSLTIIGENLNGGRFKILSGISSQFISALLLIAPSYQNDLEIILEGEIVSRSYIEMTIKIMQDFGVIVNFSGNRLFIKAGQKYREVTEYNIESDYSSACYFWTLGALSRSSISTYTNNKKSIQPDYKFLSILKKVGANITVGENEISVCKGDLNGISVEMINMPDQVPTLVILMLFANSKTTITNIDHLKYKESNRIAVLVAELSRIGVDISYKNGMLIVYPLLKDIGNMILETYGDHRLVMTFSILQMIFPQIEISDTDSVDKSYPSFLINLQSLKR